MAANERQIVLFPSPAWRDKTGETRAFEHSLTTDDSMRSLSLHFSCRSYFKAAITWCFEPDITFALFRFFGAYKSDPNVRRGNVFRRKYIVLKWKEKSHKEEGENKEEASFYGTVIIIKIKIGRNDWILWNSRLDRKRKNISLILCGLMCC